MRKFLLPILSVFVLLSNEAYAGGAYNARCDIDRVYDDYDYDFDTIVFDTYGCDDKYIDHVDSYVNYYKVLFQIREETGALISQVSKVYSQGNNIPFRVPKLVNGNYTVEYYLYEKGSFVATLSNSRAFKVTQNNIVYPVKP